MREQLRTATTRFGRSRAAMYAAAGVGICAFGVLMLLAVTAQRGLPGRSYYDLTAQFRDAGNVGKFSEVRIAGKRVGQVLSLSSTKGIAHVRLQLFADTGPLAADTTARVRLKGLLGAKFIELTPGTSGRSLPDGGIIPVSRTSMTTDLIATLQTLDAPRRAHLRATIRALGGGFADRGQELNRALAAAPRALRDASAIAGAIAARPGAARRLAPSAAAGAAAFDPVREDLARGLAPAARSLRPFAAGRRHVQAALQEAPPALATLRRDLAETDPLLAETAGFARAAVRLTRPAPAALRSTTDLLRASRRPLRTTRMLLRRLEAAVPPTLGLTRAVDPLIPPVSRSLRNSLPSLRAFAAHRCDFLPFVRNWRSMLSFGPALGGGDLGPPTMLRLVMDVVTPDLAGDTAATPAAVGGRNPYPGACVWAKERLR